MAFRITVYWQNGIWYSWIEFDSEDYPYEEGDWIAPFQNEPGNSLAYGIIERLRQSDARPSATFGIPVEGVTIERLVTHG